jgi:hypothetical protein
LPLQGQAALSLFLLCPFLFLCSHAAAQSGGSSPQSGNTQPLQTSVPSLPDAPQVASAQAASEGPAKGASASTTADAALYHPHRYAEIIEPEWQTNVLTPGQKLIFALRENIRPITLIPGLYSAGYEQLRDSNPKYGTDSGAGAAKFGAAMARSGSVRLFSDGVFAPLFHQDPRYYRMAHGSIWRRTAYAARSAFVRRGDDGSNEFNSSGIAGRAASAVLTLAYYPPVSRKTGVVFRTFGSSVLTDAGGNFVFEFVPDLARKFPVIKRFEIE